MTPKLARFPRVLPSQIVAFRGGLSLVLDGVATEEKVRVLSQRAWSPRCWETTRTVGGLPRIADEPPRPVSCPPDIPTSGHTSQEVRPSAGLHVCPSSQVDHSGSGGSTTLDLSDPYGIPLDLEFLV